MKIYTIRRKETGQTLREYVSSFKLSQYGYGHTIECIGGCGPNVKTLQEGPITYLLSEQGTPGLTYSAGWDGMQVYWLDTKYWEAEFRTEAIKNRKFV